MDNNKPTQAKAYKLPPHILEQIRKAAAEYGVQSRAFQVDSQLLIRMKRDNSLEPNFYEAEGQREDEGEG